MLRALFAFLLCILALNGYAQIELQAIVKSSKDSTALENVHILVLGKGEGTISSSAGSFFLKALTTDKIAFSRLGYASKIYLASDLAQLNTVYLDELIYQLDEVEASDRARIEAFKQKTIYKDPSATKRPKVVEDEEGPGMDAPPPSPEPAPINVVEYLYEQFSEKAQDKQKYRKLNNWSEKVEYWQNFLSEDLIAKEWGIDKATQAYYWMHIKALPGRRFENEYQFLKFLEQQALYFQAWK